MTKRISGTACRRRLPRAISRPLLRKYLLLLVAVVAAVGLGLGLAVQDHVRHPVPLTETENAQWAALNTANRLAERATVLAKAPVPAGVPAGVSSPVPTAVPPSFDEAAESPGKTIQKDSFAAAAEVLRQQAVLLRTPSHARTPAGQSTTQQPTKVHDSAVTELPRQSPAQRPPPELSPAGRATNIPEDFIAELVSSAQDNLAGARISNPGIARLLASIGTGQLLLAVELADRHQLPEPTFTPEETVTYGPAAARPTTCPSPEPTLSAPDTAAAMPASPESVAGPGPDWSTQSTALLSVLRAEEQAAYAYEVASTDMPAPANAASRERHVLAASELQWLLHRARVSAPPPLEAYALTPDFLDNPGAGLEQLEQQLVASYADLIGLSSSDDGEAGTARTWAVNQLAGSALQLRNPDVISRATPGL